MGVKGIWSLLGATGRKAEVQCLGNKAVAVDASIWIVQVNLYPDDDSLPFPPSFRNPCLHRNHAALVLGKGKRGMAAVAFIFAPPPDFKAASQINPAS